MNLSQKYVVRLHGRPINSFATKEEANKFIIWFANDQKLQNTKLDYIDAAVDKSDLKQAKDIINHIMRK